MINVKTQAFQLRAHYSDWCKLRHEDIGDFDYLSFFCSYIWKNSSVTLVDVSKRCVRELGIRACLSQHLNGFRRNKLILCERERERRGEISSSK